MRRLRGQVLLYIRRRLLLVLVLLLQPRRLLAVAASLGRVLVLAGREPGLDLRCYRKGEALGILQHVPMLDEVQVVANVDARVHPEPAANALVLRGCAAGAAARELEAAEELDPARLVGLLVLPDRHLAPVELRPELVRSAVDLLCVGVGREAHLQKGMSWHSLLEALGADDAVRHTERAKHRDEDDGV
eukprot:CAMPEP_0195122356 /NCGR_PEP_ID=MMETSP0448-20130528/126258_1 /TAXON_ID=66468 /ORGANISM="Heterocapsa triquestra, Strain CCMP 448" /LENGTH=188 /DNA_ID=CAMNT_0040159845 /DNA_START=13 /DNA_END=576 /DNA_ORIENTATION=-